MKTSVNYVELSRILGGAAVRTGPSRFGVSHAFQVAGDIIRHRPETVPDIEFSHSDDKVILEVFRKWHDGLAVDRFLADPELAMGFAENCQKLGIKKSLCAINRRLLAMRKATGGGRIPKADPTVTKLHLGLRDRMGPAVEAALAVVRVRFGASVDDVLADPLIGEAFDELARSVIDDGSQLEYRICALQIRKHRRLARNDKPLFNELDPLALSPRLQLVGAVDSLDLDDVPDEDGIIVVSSSAAPIYVMSHRSLPDAASWFSRSEMLSLTRIPGSVMRIDAADTCVHVVPSRELPMLQRRTVWEMRLIRDYKPMLNLPIRGAA